MKLNIPNLLSYSSAATAFLTSVNANAQILYVDIDPDVVLIDTNPGSENESYFLDMDNDGWDDFQFFHAYEPGSWLQAGGVYMLGDESVLVENYMSVSPQLAVVEEGEVIGDGGNFIHAQTMSGSDPMNLVIMGLYATYWGVFSAGLWAGGQYDKYAGLKLNLADGPHYGWVRLDVTETFSEIHLKDFAFSLEPGQSIIAGDATTSIVHQQENEINAFYEDGSIHVQLDVNQNAQISIFDLSGQLIYSETVTGGPQTFNMNSFSNEIYVIVVNDGVTMRSKKIFAGN